MTTPGPWVWGRMGYGWTLIGNHGMRPIVLGARGVRKSPGPPPPADLVVRDAARDLLVPFDPDHPDAQLIAAAPTLLAALRALAAEPEEQIAFLKGLGFDGPPLALRCGGRWDHPGSYAWEGDHETDLRWTHPDRELLRTALIAATLAKTEQLL